MFKKLVISLTLLVFPMACIADQVGIGDFMVRPTCANAPSAKFQISGTSEMDFDIMRGGFSMDRVLLLAPLGSALKIND
ncbi:MAG: hypothetical protein AB8F34_04770, partial [Akkermansiaceae bacterium]